MTDLPPSRAQALRGRRREEILHAAAELFVRSGFDGTGMAAIAKATGLSIGGVYRHFPGKEGIVAALVERDLAEQRSRLARVVAAAPAAPARTRIAAVVRALVIAQIPDRDTAALGVEFCAAATRSTRIAALLAGHAEAVEAAVRAALPGPDPGPATTLLVTVLDGLMLRAAIAGISPEELEEAVVELTALVAIAAQGAPRI